MCLLRSFPAKCRAKLLKAQQSTISFQRQRKSTGAYKGEYYFEPPPFQKRTQLVGDGNARSILRHLLFDRIEKFKATYSVSTPTVGDAFLCSCSSIFVFLLLVIAVGVQWCFAFSDTWISLAFSFDIS